MLRVGLYIQGTFNCEVLYPQRPFFSYLNITHSLCTKTQNTDYAPEQNLKIKTHIYLYLFVFVYSSHYVCDFFQKGKKLIKLFNKNYNDIIERFN